MHRIATSYPTSNTLLRYHNQSYTITNENPHHQGADPNHQFQCIHHSYHPSPTAIQNLSTNLPLLQCLLQSLLQYLFNPFTSSRLPNSIPSPNSTTALKPPDLTRLRAPLYLTIFQRGNNNCPPKNYLRAPNTLVGHRTSRSETTATLVLHLLDATTMKSWLIPSLPLCARRA